MLPGSRNQRTYIDSASFGPDCKLFPLGLGKELLGVVIFGSGFFLYASTLAIICLHASSISLARSPKISNLFSSLNFCKYSSIYCQQTSVSISSLPLSLYPCYPFSLNCSVLRLRLLRQSNLSIDVSGKFQLRFNLSLRVVLVARCTLLWLHKDRLLIAIRSIRSM